MPHKSIQSSVARLIAILWLANGVQESTGQAVITYTTPRRGSIAGGTKVTAYGRSFTTDSYTSSNYVFLGSVPCIVEPYTVSAHRLECTTSAHPDAVEGYTSNRLQASVITNGQLSISRNSDESFFYDWNHTPQIRTVEPKSTPLGSLIEVGGYRMYWDYKYYESFYVGGAVCEIRNQTKNDHFGIRWRWPLHLVKCLVTEQRAGGWNASVIINRWRGRTWNHSQGLYPMHDWRLAMYELYPDIHQVYPQEGSIHGGTLVTITGTGFSAEDGEVEVDIDGIACKVISHTSTEIRCLTGSPPHNSPAVANESGAYPVTENGYRFRGGRGVNFLQYSGINGNRLQNLHSSSVYPDAPLRKGIYPSFSTLSNSKRNNYGERLTAFFNPHASGNHTFFITSDDEGGLWFSPRNNINIVDDNKIISNLYVSGWQNYYRYQNQRSNVEYLEMSEDYILTAEFKDGGGEDYIQVGVLIHESDFTYDETQQVARERQRVELSSEGLYDTQMLSITVNTTELDVDHLPTFVVEWGERQSRTFTFPELLENTSMLGETVLRLFSGLCDYGLEIGVNHYREVYSFEGGLSDAWSSWNGGQPEVSEDEAFCGRHSLFVHHGRAMAFDISQPDDNDGYRVSDYPFLCLAYKLSQGHPMTLAVNINDIGWRSIAMTSTDSYTFPLIGSVWDYSDDDLIDDNNWHYSCTDLQGLLMQSLQHFVPDGNENSIPTYQIVGLGFYSNHGGTNTIGFYIDEMSVSSEKRNFVWENYLSPARPNGIALHDIVTTTQMNNDSDIVNLMVSMEIVPSTCDYDIPLINVTLLDLQVTPGVVEFNFSKVQEASIPISGTFQLLLGDSSTTSLVYGATALELKQAIEAADNFGHVTVTYSNTPLNQDRLGKFCPGRRFTVQFEDAPGDLPLLEVNTSYLHGDGLTARVMEEVTGGLFLRPIPGHMLQTVERTPQVHVRIREQLAACGGGFGLAEEIPLEEFSDFCMFKYSPTSTPMVDLISPSSARSGDSIEIRGSGFSQKLEEIYITFGDVECQVTSSTETTIHCTLSESFAGPKPLYLQVSSRGTANTTGIVLDYSLELVSINPSEGSIAGGTLVTISGLGFYDSTYNTSFNTNTSTVFGLPLASTPNDEDCHSQWQNIVTMGDNVCEVIQSSPTTLTIRTPAESNNVSTYDVVVTVLCPERPQASSSMTLTGSYTYSRAYTPIITSVQPTEGQIQGGDSITLYGSGFSDVADENTVEIGHSLCNISSSSGTQITCITPAHPIGEFDVYITVSGKGRASGAVTFTYQLEINSVSHCEGSLFGGQTLEIDGHGFGHDHTEVEVRLGDHQCNIVRHTNTNIVCVTPSTATEHNINNNASHDEYGLGYMWNPSSLTVKVGDTVHWSWTGSPFVVRRGVAEITTRGDTEYNGVGFRSRQSVTGNFSHTFTTPGTYYYITEGYAHLGFNGSITVVDKEDVTAELTFIVNSVLVNTSGFQITCRDTNTLFQTYTYSVASTPVIHSVSHAATVGDRIHLVINGLSSMAEDNVFVFGGHAPITCMSSNFSSRTVPLNTTSAVMRTYLATSEVECTVPDVSPGIYRAVLHVAGRGWSYASIESSVVHIQPRIDSVGVLRGSLRGGTSLVLGMTGLSPSDIAKTRVFIGNTPCLLQSISNRGEAECTTQPAKDDGYSSLIYRDSPLAYWSLQADYYRSNGSYVSSDGEYWFRSGGKLGVRANASIHGTVMLRQRGISDNAATDQSALFQSSYMQTSVLPEFCEATSFAMDLWIKVPQMSGRYQVVVNSSSFTDGVAGGFLLMLNPCHQLEFWVATGVSLQDQSINASLGCELVADISHCSQICSGLLYVPESASLPSGVWSIIRAEYANLSSWQYVHFGWTANSTTSHDECLSPGQCSGLQILHINNNMRDETTTYLPYCGVPVSIGGSASTPQNDQALAPFVGYLDEIAFYHRPLVSKQVQTRVQYGASDSQPIWITVNGVDGVGQGNVPNVFYQKVDQGFTNDTVVNWEEVQELHLDIEESSAVRFEWTGLHGILETSRSAFEECDLSSPYIKEWFPTKKGGVMTFTPQLGAVYYFIDSLPGGCQNGRKIRIQAGDVEVIDWRLGQYRDMTISDDTGLLFHWDGSIPHNLFEMTTAVSSSEECHFVSESSDKIGKVKRKWQDEPITAGEVSISGLSEGEYHFVCAVNGHCEAGMRFSVTVTPSEVADRSTFEQDFVKHTIPWRVQEYEDLVVHVGERITFAWQGFHSLHQVTEDVYTTCDINAGSLYVWGEPSVDNSATIEGLVPGSYYFLCSVAGHCDAGMKLKVIILPDDGLPALNNGIEAICAHGVDCSFSYSTDSTPQLLQIEPTESVAGALITLTGHELIPQGMSAGANLNSVTVLIDKAPCENVIVLSSTQDADMIQCTVTDYESGYYFVDVFVDGKGFASVNPTDLVPGSIRNSTIIANSHSTYPTFFLSAMANTISPSMGSRLGGTLIAISGSGFSYLSSHLTVEIGSIPCHIVSSTFSKIQCITSAASTSTSADVRITVNGFPVNSTLQFEQSHQSTPTITQLDQHSVTGSEQIVISGTKFGTNASAVQVQIIGVLSDFDFVSSTNSCLISAITDNTIACMVPTKPAGRYSVHILVQGVGFANPSGDNSLSYRLSVDSFSPLTGGNGGGIPLTINGAGFPDIPFGGEYSSIVVALCNSQIECSVTESSFSRLICTLGSNSHLEQNCSITVTCNGITEMSSGLFQFASILTPEITGLSPTVGGTAGGTNVSLTGNGFFPINVTTAANLQEGDIVITIDQAPCEWYGYNYHLTDTSITCRTSEHRTTLQATVRLFVRGKGYAVHSNGTMIFEYVDRWSSVFTWGGNPLPREGESVYIKVGQTVYLDVSPPVLNLILIEGSLIFEDEQDLHLQAKYIFVNGGKFQIGTESNPFQHRAIVTLHGHITDPEIPIYGAKVLGIRQGQLDLHGIPRSITWTRLAATALVNATSLQLQQAVDWVRGDRIVIAPTGKDGNETEENEVSSVSANGRTLNLMNPLKFTHHGVTETFEDGHSIEMRAEVGLLSHNVIVEGTRLESAYTPHGLGADQYGAQIFIHRRGPDPTPIRIEHTEVRYSGQAFRLGRYSIHFHLSGTMNGSYIRNCAIHHSNNRAITAHGVHDLLIEGNVAYDIKGHTYFVEDGVETNNQYIRNLGVLTRGSSSLLNTDQIPATFWITNPQNTFIGNAAAASRAYGFWYDLDNHPSGASFTWSVCPNKETFGVFVNNTAHTCSEFGLRIWETYLPYADGCRARVHQVATLYYFTSYANGIHGVELSIIGHIRLVGFKVADNVKNGIEIIETRGEWGGPKIQDSLIISHTSINTGEPQKGGIKTPNTPRLTISNVTFANFDRSSMSCLKACSHCKFRQGGFEVWFERLNFIGGSQNNKAAFQWEFEVLYKDLDGTLTGLEGGGWVLPNSDLVPPEHCSKSVPAFSLNDTVINGTVCNRDINFLRMAWNQAEPLATFHGVDVIVDNEYGRALVPWRHYRLTHMDGYMFTMPDSQTYNITWLNPDAHRVDTTFYNSGVYGVKPSTRIWVTHQFVMLPDHIEVGNNYEGTEHGDVPRETDNNLSWHINNETNVVTYLISGGNLTSENNNVTYEYSYEPCPRDGCPPPGIDFGPYEAVQRRWSDPNSWPSGELPREGEEVTISSRWRMLVDISPPPLGRVIVLGELMFEDERDYNFTANLILINGPMARMIIGTESRRFTHSVVITLTGRREDVPLVLSSVIVGSKAIGVFGNLSIHGIRRSRSWTRLSSSAESGATSITVQGNPYPNWRAGDKVVIAPSGWSPEEAEIRTITAINGGRITLNEPLTHDHIVYSFMESSDFQLADPPQTSGSPQWWGNGGLMAPEVGLLSHNVVIQGGEDPGQLLEQHHYGCRILVGKYATHGYNVHGHLKLDSVELRYCGQGGFFSPRDPRYAIVFRNNFNSSNGSHIRHCSVHHGYNTAIGVHTSFGVEINSNVIWRTTDSGIKVGRRWNSIVNNLAMMTTTIQPNSPPDNHAVDFPATFDIDGENIVRGNAAAGSTRIAFRYAGEPCLNNYTAPTYEAAMFWNNTAHTGLVGLNVLGLPYECTAIGGFTASHQWNYAVFSSTASSISATHLKVAVGKVGLNLNVFGPNPVAHLLGNKSITIRDSLIVGSLPGEGCVRAAPDFRVRGSVSFTLNDHKLGIMMSSFNAKRSKMDGTGAWHLMKGYPVIDGVTVAERVSFARFFDKDCLYSSYAIGNNPLSPDAMHPMHITMTTKFNVNMSSLIFYYEPNVDWIVQEDCVDMDCDGPKHSLVKDLDGRFVGTFPAEGSVVPFAELRFSNFSHRLPVTWLASLREGEIASPDEVLENMGIARGEPNNLDSPNGGCEWKEPWRAYRCKTLKHQMLIIESMDEDTETRRLSPLALTGGDTGHGEYTDLINGPMDHGSSPSSIRFILLNAGDDEAVKLCIWFKGTSRKDVYKNGIFIEPENVRYLTEGGIEQLDGDHIPDRSYISGANYFERESQIMHFIVKGSNPVEIRTPPVIQVSMSLAVSIDDFFSIGDLIKNLAFVLKIDPNKIRVVKIVSEDTPVRVRRSLLATSGFNQTSITLEFGNLPAPNITVPMPPTVAEEIVMARETNDSVDLEDDRLQDPPLEGSNPLNEDPPDTISDFVENLNSSIVDYNDRVTEYEEVLQEVESTNTIGEHVINLILTNEVENITNATVVSLSVVPALPPPPPSPPILPPRYENITDKEGDPVIIEEIQLATPPTLAVDVSNGTSDTGDVSIDFVIPSEMRVTMEPHQQTGHLVHVAVTIFDSNGQPVINLGLVNPWKCEASLVLTKAQEGSTQLSGITTVPFVRGVAEFTRLRIDNPAQDLTLQFQTIPSRFEVRTSVLFSVLSPPYNTTREKVGFLLEGNLGTLSNNKAEILEDIRLGLSTSLDVDISRLKDLDFTSTYRGLVVSFDLLNRQPTDPPDVSSLEESLSQLQDLISSGTLTISIGGETFTASPESFEFVTPPPPSRPINATFAIIIAVCAAATVILVIALFFTVLCCCVRVCKRRSGKQKGKGNRDVPLHKISPMPTKASQQSTAAVDDHAGKSAAARKILLVKESEVFVNPHGDCWDYTPPPWATAAARPHDHQHHYRHRPSRRSSKASTSLSALANSMQSVPNQPRVTQAGGRPMPMTTQHGFQDHHEMPREGSYLVRHPRKPSNHGRQGWL